MKGRLRVGQYLKGLSLQEEELIIPHDTVPLGYVGSIAHGTYRPSTDPGSIDDVDLMGVCIPSIENYFGFVHFEQHEKKYKEWDVVVYEIRKLFRLLLQGNPNVLGILFLRDQDYIIKDEVGRLIIQNRESFVSKQSYYSFVGYAVSQLHRMEHFSLQWQEAFDRLESQMVLRFGSIPEDTGKRVWDENKKPIPPVATYSQLSDAEMKSLHHWFEHRFLGG